MRWLVRWVIDGKTASDMLVRTEDAARDFARVIQNLHPTDTVFVAEVGV